MMLAATIAAVRMVLAVELYYTALAMDRHTVRALSFGL